MCGTAARLRRPAHRASALLEAGLLFIVSRTYVSFLINKFVVEPRCIRAKCHSGVILDGQRGKQGVVDLVNSFAHRVSDRVCLVIVLHVLKARVQLRLLDVVVVIGVSLGLRDKH